MLVQKFPKKVAPKYVAYLKILFPRKSDNLRFLSSIPQRRLSGFSEKAIALDYSINIVAPILGLKCEEGKGVLRKRDGWGAS